MYVEKLQKYEFLIWVAASMALFLYAVPLESETLIKLIAGYIFYLLIRQVFRYRSEKDNNLDRTRRELEEQLEKMPHKTSVYLHRHGSLKKSDEPDIRSYL